MGIPSGKQSNGLEGNLGQNMPEKNTPSSTNQYNGIVDTRIVFLQVLAILGEIMPKEWDGGIYLWIVLHMVRFFKLTGERNVGKYIDTLDAFGTSLLIFSPSPICKREMLNHVLWTFERNSWRRIVEGIPPRWSSDRKHWNLCMTTW